MSSDEIRWMPEGWHYAKPIGPQPDRDGWTTRESIWRRPLHAFGLEAYHLDPCTNSRATVPALRTCSLERGEDGLLSRLEPGQVGWLNHPFSVGLTAKWFAWAVRQARRGATVCGLTMNAPDTNAWHDYGPTCAWAPRGRTRCDPPPGAVQTSPDRVMVPCIWTLDGARLDAWRGAHRGGTVMINLEPWQCDA